MPRNRIPSLTTGAAPFERGRAHGRAFAADVAANLETYLRRFEASGLSRADAFAEAARWRKAMAAQNADYAAEMRGIADGARAKQWLPRPCAGANP